MDYKRLSIAAVAAWVVDCIYGFLVFGVLLQSEFARYPDVFRSYDQVNALVPLMFASMLIGTFVVAYIFAKGHEGGNGLAEGIRFGILFGLFGLFVVSIPDYVVYSYGRKLAVYTAVANFIEMVITGVVLGLIYRPRITTTASEYRRPIAV